MSAQSDRPNPREEPEYGPAQAFQSEDREHAPGAPAGSEHTDAHQHEDDELVWPID